ncbi:hypothetical protein K2Y11_16500 [bacterium]|nr:hypothetical protein [bacterium]
MRHHRGTVLCAVLVLTASTLQAAVIPQLDFHAGPLQTGASFSYAGGASPLIGSGIDPDTVAGLNTPANSNVIRDLFDNAGIFPDANLSFVTGSLYGSDPSSWLFSAGGSLSITGSVDLNGNQVIDGGDIVNQVLASGVMDNSAIINAAGTFYVLGGGTFSYVNPQLASFFGFVGNQISPADGAVNLLFTLPATAVGGSPFISNDVLSGDIAFAVPTSLFQVPEASTMVMTSLAFIGGCAGVWRKRRKNAE